MTRFRIGAQNVLKFPTPKHTHCSSHTVGADFHAALCVVIGQGAQIEKISKKPEPLCLCLSLCLWLCLCYYYCGWMDAWWMLQCCNRPVGASSSRAQSPSCTRFTVTNRMQSARAHSTRDAVSRRARIENRELRLKNRESSGRTFLSNQTRFTREYTIRECISRNRQ